MEGELDACLVVLLLANATWDLACATWMMAALHQPAAAPPHWAVWHAEEDRRNLGARLLWCALVAQWGLVRLWGACVRWLFPHQHPAALAALWLVFGVYELEACVMLAGILSGTMVLARAAPSAALSQVGASFVMVLLWL